MIAIDGPSGIGKSTVAEALGFALARAGYQNAVRSNNDSTPFGPLIRELAGEGGSSYALALAVAAARAVIQHDGGDTLTICDRHILSSLVYQHSCGIPTDYLYLVNRPFLGNVLFVALDLPEKELLARREQRNDDRTDRFKGEMSAALELRLFGEAASALRARGHDVATVAAHGSAEEVAQRIFGEVAPLLPRVAV